MKPVEYIISKVTVYSDRAQVSRFAEVELEKGEHLVVFDELPENTNPESLQVKGTGNAVLREVKWQKVRVGALLDKFEQTLYAQKETQEDSLKDLDDSIAHATKEKTFVESIAGKLTSVGDKSFDTQLDPQNWVKMVEFYRTRLDALDNEIRTTERKKRDLKNALQRTNLEISDLSRNRSKTKNQAHVLVDVKENGRITIELSYLVTGCSWKPVYDIRVSTEDSQIELNYNALVQQSTSESWNNTQLFLSTAQPKIGGEEPKLSPWRLKFETYYEVEEERSSPKVEAAPMMRSAKKMAAAPSVGAAMDEFEPQDMLVPQAEVTTGATSVVFGISGINTINNDNQQHKVTILLQKFAAEFRYSTVPKLAPYAYLKAKTRNETDFPLLAGVSNIFLDNNFVASAKLELVAPSEEFKLSLGVDESIKVEQKLINRFKKEEGLLSKTTKLIYEYNLLVTNNKKRDVLVTVIDQLPIPSHEDIHVELMTPKYKEDTDKLKIDSLKKIEWTETVPKAEKLTIPFKFSVSYPSAKDISGIEDLF